MATHSRTASIGTEAPDFTLPDGDGTPVGLAEFLARGPVVVAFLRGFP